MFTSWGRLCPGSNDCIASVKLLERSVLWKWLGPCYLALPMLFHSAAWLAFGLFSALLALVGCAQRHLVARQPYLEMIYHRIAVLPFESANPYVEGTTLSDYFIVQILRDVLGMQVIERKDLMKILQEQKLSLTGIVRPDKFLKLGSILGVDAILVGSVQTLETIQSVSGTICVTVKLMEVSTGRILWADRQVISHSTWSSREVPEVASALMEKAAKKMVKRLRESDVMGRLTEAKAGEAGAALQEARAAVPAVR